MYKASLFDMPAFSRMPEKWSPFRMTTIFLVGATGSSGSCRWDNRSFTRRGPVEADVAPVLEEPLGGKMNSPRRTAVEITIKNRTKDGVLSLNMGWSLPAECPEQMGIR
jgi:hypothetical protein